MPRTRTPQPVRVDVQVTDERGPRLAEYAEQRVRSVFRYTREPVLHARVRVVRHGNPALDRPVTAQANLDVNGRPVRAQVSASTGREAVDLLADRLRNRLRHHVQRVGAHWEARRGRMSSGRPHEWRHGDLPTRRGAYFPRPPEEREIVRHKSFTLAGRDVDEAIEEMEAMDYDFHLFTESGSGQDSMLYRAGPTGYRLAQLKPRQGSPAPHDHPVTISDQPAPVLDTTEAAERMALLGLDFLFFLDGERGRGAVIYRRYDGHYGLITPAG
jgi:ribosome-associated translation inhibitor RaiA